MSVYQEIEKKQIHSGSMRFNPKINQMPIKSTLKKWKNSTEIKALALHATVAATSQILASYIVPYHQWPLEHC